MGESLVLRGLIGPSSVRWTGWYKPVPSNGLRAVSFGASSGPSFVPLVVASPRNLIEIRRLWDFPGSCHVLSNDPWAVSLGAAIEPSFVHAVESRVLRGY